MAVRLLVVAAALVAAPTLAAAERPPPVELAPGHTTYPVVGHIEHLADDTTSLTFDDVRSVALAARWETIERADPNYGFSDAAHWLRFRVHNPRDTRADSVAAFRYPLLDYVDAYVERPDGSFERHAIGDRVPFSARAIPDTRLAIPIETAAGQTQHVFLRIATDASAQLRVDLMSSDRFVGEATRNEIFDGLYYGIMLVMVLYNMFLYVAVRNTSYLLYVCFVAAFACTQLAIAGSASRYLFPETPWLANLFTPLSIAIAQPLPVLFTQQFLDTRHQLPRTHRLLTGYVWLSAASIPVALFAPYPVSIRIVAGLAVLTSIVCEAVGIAAWRGGYRPARFYVLAWTALIIGTILYVLTSFNVLPANPLTLNIQRIGSALEVTLLSFALGDRIKIIETEREQARTEALALERDLALTGAVQQLLLPQRSDFDDDGVRLAGFYRSATRCGGDWWWYDRFDDGRLLVILGDVTGHGAAAAMMTAAVAAAYRGVPRARREADVDAVLGSLNDSFHAISRGVHHMALTALELDLARRRLRLWSGGAPPVFALHADASVTPLISPGRPLGDPTAKLGQLEYSLQAGDRLLVFSDGVPEMAKANGRQLGYRGVERLLVELGDADVAEARDRLAANLDAKRGDQPQDDDVTFVLIDVDLPGHARSAA